MDEDHRDKEWLGPWYQIWEEARYIEKETWTNYDKAMTHIVTRRFKLQKDLRGEYDFYANFEVFYKKF